MLLEQLSSLVEGWNWVQKAQEKTSVEGISLPQAPRKNTLCFVKSVKFLKKLKDSASEDILSTLGLVVEEKLYQEIISNQEWKSLLEQMAWTSSVPNVPLAMCLISKPFYQEKFGSINSMVDGRQMGTCSIHPTALISQNVFIGEDVVIEQDVEILSGVVIQGKCRIGAGTKIYPNVTIYPFTQIGSNCRIHAGVVIGSDGFGYQYHQGKHLKIWHMGGVVIGNEVEIGSNTTIDMGTFNPTMIGDGVIIDNLVQVAHNVRLGRGVVVCGQAGLAGSSSLGDFCVLGGKAGIGPDVEIGAGSQIAGNAMVTGHWPAGSKLGGHPARPLDEWMRSMATLRRIAKE